MSMSDGRPECVVVEGINLATCYTRPVPQKNEPGGIVKQEASLHVSNVSIIDRTSGLPARVKVVITKSGRERSFFVSKKRREAASQSVGRSDNE